MKSTWRRPAAWIRVLATSIWACYPAFLFYVLVLQPPVPSLSRMAISALFVPVLAMLGYKTSAHFGLFSRTHWVRLLAASAIAAGLATLILAHNAEKSYLFAGPHTLRVEPLGLSGDQSIELRWFTTTIGDVSFDTLQEQEGWMRSADGLRVTAGSEGPLIWRGLVGAKATLTFTGTPGTALRVLWDGNAQELEFTQGRSRAVVERTFSLPWWGLIALSLLLLGTLVFGAALITLNSQNVRTSATLPGWLGWLLLIGLYISLLLLASNLSGLPGQLPLLIALTCLLTVPAWLFDERLAKAAGWHRGLEYVDEVLRQHTMLLVILGSAALAFGVFGQTMRMNWTGFDDHQIMQYVGPGHSLSLGQMWDKLPSTEIGQFGSSERFRPTYWFLRLLECVAWGAHPHLWHAFRVLILAVSLSLIWTVLTPSLGWIGAGLLCAYTLTFTYWDQVFAWLGPGETYAVAGLALYVWGAVRVLRFRRDGMRKNLAAEAAVVFGSMICIGSKENLVLLVVPSAYLGYHALRDKDKLTFASALISILFASYVGASVVLALRHGGVDVYSQPVSPAQRIANSMPSLYEGRFGAPLLVLAALTVAPAAGLLVPGLPNRARDSILRAQGWLAALCLLYLSQLIFYNGEWPTGTRYDFPGMLYIPAALVVLTIYGIQIAPDTQLAAFSRAWRLALVGSLAAVTLTRGYGSTIMYVDQMVKATNQYVEGIEHAAATLQAHPDFALVIESGSVDDYEAVFSHEEFLRAYGVQNSIFLRLHDYSLATARGSQETKLVTDLVDVSARGTGGFQPLDELDAFGEKCFSLVLSRDYETGCQPLK